VWLQVRLEETVIAGESRPGGREMKAADENSCRLVSSEILRLVPCDRIAIALPLADGSGFRICGTHPAIASLQDVRVPAEGSCSALVAAQRHGKLLSAMGEESHFSEEEALYRAGFRDAAFVPLFQGGELQGVAIVGRSEVNSLEPRSLRCLEKVSGLLAALLAASLESAAAPPTPADLPSFARKMAGEEERDGICRGLLEAVREAAGPRRAILTLLDSEMKGYQWFFTGHTDAEIDEFHRHPLSDEEQREIFRTDRDPSRAGSESATIHVPLLGSRERPLGFVTLEYGSPSDPARSASLPALAVMAGLVAFALERNQLQEEIRKERNRTQKTQEQLVHSERLAALGQMVSGVAHELNNPLAGVVGFAELAIRNNTNPRCERDLERIVKESHRCQHIVRNLLHFARRTKAEQQAMDVNALVENVLDLQSYQLRLDNIKVRFDPEPDLPKTVGDCYQIQQVLLNIINNAHQAMMETQGERSLILRTRTQKGVLRIQITDTGPGISPGRLSRVFEPFFTTKAPGKGTGLGLSLSQGIVKQHGGRITVQSVVGKGATFTVELPVREASEDKEVLSRPADEAAAGGSRTILVVDDEEVIVDLLHEVLAAVGHKVETARSGKQALDMILSNGFDAVISDLKMPELDGVGLYEQVCRSKPEMARRFVFSTGDVASESTRDFFRKTGCPYLMKPFDLDAVRSTLSRILADA
jgi:signal transduction histidine kinase/ActR/RegA family two-component response regulator